MALTKGLQMLAELCSCCFSCIRTSSSRSGTPNSQRPLLDRLQEEDDMGKGRTYGKKSGLANSKVAASFGEASSGKRKPLGAITNGAKPAGRAVEEDDSDDSVQNLYSNSGPEIRFAHHGFRNTAATVISDPKVARHTRFGTDGTECIRPVHNGLSQLVDGISKLAVKGEPSGCARSSEQAADGEASLKGTSDNSAVDVISGAEDLSVEPLLSVVAELYPENWDFFDWEDVFSNDINIQVSKIAEASFSEVYCLHSPDGMSSIVKVMRIKVDAERGSASWDTLATASTMISELRIMRSLDRIPGFVQLAQACIARGPSCRLLSDAHDAYRARFGDTEHMRPRYYTDDTTFLVVELSDAGHVLEHIQITSINEVWDVLVSTTLALARAEVSVEFEHRDLHENNICYDRSSAVERHPESPDQKFGFSGIGITIIDFGLSRAKVQNGDVVYKDLEIDRDLFNGSAHIQFETYRRMRNYLMSERHQHQSANWHRKNDLSPDKSWAKFMPYNNVLWIRYIHRWLVTKKIHKLPRVLNEFLRDTEEFEKKLTPRTLHTYGGFNSAAEVLKYMMEKGWINEQQVIGDGSVLSDLSVLSETSILSDTENVEG